MKGNGKKIEIELTELAVSSCPLALPNKFSILGCGAVTNDDMLRILIMGKAGNGKSSVGNTILREDRFPTGEGLTPATVTTDFAYSSGLAQKFKVIDTPDLTNIGMSQSQMECEVSMWKDLTSPYPSAILHTVRCDVRYTPEEHAIYKQMKNLWGDTFSFCQRLIVGLTFKDRQKGDIDQELRTTAPKELKSVLRDAGGRYVAFNNKAQNKDWQVEQLVKLIHTMSAERSKSGFRYNIKRALLGVAFFAAVFAVACVTTDNTTAAEAFGAISFASAAGWLYYILFRSRRA
ncbi:hypothetical protein BaRGS_00030589 [Batillaria attramentaria]|uniref:AIG1-type G domain-containing protein n=1 Tax=Batillaria attramentaria TaxID=370345 RepID=A0ABD0JU34_9CAEN